MMGQTAPIYLQAEFNVARAHHAAFVKKMQEILPVIFSQYGWELIYGAYPIVGQVNRFIHIWRIPNEESVLKVMRDGAVTMGEPDQDSPKRASAEEPGVHVFKKLYSELQGLITDTTHTLTTSLPHDPTYFGEQAQTLLIDDKGKAFLIDHAQLRSEFANKTEKIEQLEPPLAWTTWKNSAVSNSNLSSAREKQELQERNADSPLSTFLKQGVLVASLPDHRRSAAKGADAGRNRRLLFNLAGIKPRSVFQEDPAPRQTHVDQANLSKEAHVAFPRDVTELLISTPWGTVYRLEQQDVDRIASPLPQGRVANATARVLAPLIEARVPLANIPQEPPDIIGDGCMCFVINLSSFSEDGR